MNATCGLETMHRQPTLAVRTRTSVETISGVLGRIYQRVMECAARREITPAGPPFVIYHNMEMSDLDIEAGFPVDRDVEGTGDVHAGEIEACETATCVHTGSYDTIGESYSALMNWMEEQGLVATGIAYEFYLNDPIETPPDQLKTRIAFPLQPIHA